MKKILIIGLASGKIKELEVMSPIPAELSLMDFLMLNKITIASSCGGAGTCKKCVVNSAQLSCQISLKDFMQDRDIGTVEITYL
jgi:ferredoxin